MEIKMIRPRDLKKMIDIDQEIKTLEDKEDFLITILNSDMIYGYRGYDGICSSHTDLDNFDIEVTDELCRNVAKRFCKAGWDKVFYKIKRKDNVLIFRFLMDFTDDYYLINRGYKLGAARKRFIFF